MNGLLQADVIVFCIGKRFLSVRDRWSLSQTCHFLREIFLARDQEIQYMLAFSISCDSASLTLDCRVCAFVMSKPLACYAHRTCMRDSAMAGRIDLLREFSHRADTSDLICHARIAFDEGHDEYGLLAWEIANQRPVPLFDHFMSSCVYNMIRWAQKKRKDLAKQLFDLSSLEMRRFIGTLAKSVDRTRRAVSFLALSSDSCWGRVEKADLIVKLENYDSLYDIILVKCSRPSYITVRWDRLFITFKR